MKKVYVLLGDGDPLGVYTSKKKLAQGVDYWISGKDHPVNQVLAWHEWDLNFPAYPNEWEWAYIPKGTKLSRLMEGGSSFIPKVQFHGINLVSNKWEPVDEAVIQKFFDTNHKF